MRITNVTYRPDDFVYHIACSPEKLHYELIVPGQKLTFAMVVNKYHVVKHPIHFEFSINYADIWGTEIKRIGVKSHVEYAGKDVSWVSPDEYWVS